MTVTMRAVVVEHPGGLETLEIREAPVSTPAKGEVFIRALDAEAPRGETEAGVAEDVARNEEKP